MGVICIVCTVESRMCAEAWPNLRVTRNLALEALPACSLPSSYRKGHRPPKLANQIHHPTNSLDLLLACLREAIL